MEWGGGTLLGVFLLCVCVGIIAGNYIKHQVGTASAASDNITVTNNNQVSTIDQGTPTMTRTSTVTVKDTRATQGYSFSARISQNSIPGSSVAIYSASSPYCRQSSPCIITDDPTPRLIYRPTSGVAATVQGHTTNWTITVTMPTDVPQGNYLLDIAYFEEPVITLASMTYLQDLALPENEDVCATSPPHMRAVLKDRRDNQEYYVEKLTYSGVGNTDLCWMKTNLRYGGDGDWNSTWGYPDDRYATTASNTTANINDNTRPLSTTPSGYLGGSQANAYTRAGYFDPGGSITLDVATPTNNTTFYGYLYNWCAAMGGQANACNSISTTGFDTTQSICPAGWRLPAGGGYDEGDFFYLWYQMGGSFEDNETIAANFRNDFLAVFSGTYHDALYGQGGYGRYWSSGILYGTSSTQTEALSIDDSSAVVSHGNNRYAGGSVRCVKL